MVLVLEAVRQSVYPERRAKGGALFHIILHRQVFVMLTTVFVFVLFEVLICMVVRFWYFPRRNATSWREHALHFNVLLTQELQ